MFERCDRCGADRPQWQPSGSDALLCPECGQSAPFARVRLLLIGGASGSGKSAILSYLLRRRSSVTLLDSDILWREEFNRPEQNYAGFFGTWLQLALNIGQGGRPPAIFGAGFAVPENIENRPERRFFKAVYYLGLVVEETELIQRLRARPAWRRSTEEPELSRQIQFNQWLLEQARDAHSEVEILHTSNCSAEASSRAVAAWIENKLSIG